MFLGKEKRKKVTTDMVDIDAAELRKKCKDNFKNITKINKNHNIGW